jgi:hypothetical protein
VASGQVLDVPAAGQLYHGVFTVPFGNHGVVTEADVALYESTVGARVAWVYFDHEWSAGRAFPLATAQWIQARGSVPFVRLMLRSSGAQDVAEPLYTLEAIAAGTFDADLLAWGAAAAAFGHPLIAEYGTEVNGDWFSWNGTFHGNDPSTFRAAYRHIVEKVREGGGTNVTWVFHANATDWPQDSWNHFENYYPGDDVVDWVGFSHYAANSPIDGNWKPFTSIMDPAMARMAALAPTKPFFMFEFGAPGNDTSGDAATWADEALTDFIGNRWPGVRGFSWWNEHWRTDSNSADDSDLRVEDVPGLAAVFQRQLASPNVIQRPIFK